MSEPIQPTSTKPAPKKINWKSLWWRIPAICIILFIGIVSINDNISKAGPPAPTLPDCDSLTVTLGYSSAIYGNLAETYGAVVGIQGVKTLSSNSNSNQCQAIVATLNGRVRVWYVVEWVDKERDSFNVKWNGSPQPIE